LNHEPPRPQQLLFPDFAMMPHLGHTEVMVVVVVAGGGFYEREHWADTQIREKVLAV
jgi:hypothetical protein